MRGQREAAHWLALLWKQHELALHCIVNHILTHFRNAMMQEIELASMEALMYLCIVCFRPNATTCIQAALVQNACTLCTWVIYLRWLCVQRISIWYLAHTHTLTHRSCFKPLTACANTSSWINPCSRSTVCC